MDFVFPCLYEAARCVICVCADYCRCEVVTSYARI
nr:MAG TPA: hypothetical protein [Caudoviricetes sp.]